MSNSVCVYRPVYRWFIKQKDAFEHAQKFAGQVLYMQF